MAPQHQRDRGSMSEVSEGGWWDIPTHTLFLPVTKVWDSMAASHIIVVVMLMYSCLTVF